MMNGIFLSVLSSPTIGATSSVADTPSVGRLLISLLFIIGLILVLAWLWRRGSGLTSKGRIIQVIESAAVGTREKIVLIKAGEKQLLIGVTAQQISHLHTFDKEIVLPESNVKDASFSHILTQALKGTRS